MFKAIKRRRLLKEIRTASKNYNTPLDVNNIGDVRIVTPSCDDPHEFLFVSPYGWVEGGGIVVDTKDALKLFQAKDLRDIIRLEIDVYEE